MTIQRSSRLPGLDTLRALAIVGVMRFHLQWIAPDTLTHFAHFGWMGVDLFFVLSGYLIGAQLLKAHRQGAGAGLWLFYRRRLYRILPAYLVVLTLYFTVPGWREDPHISPLWEFLTFTENLLIDYSRNHAFSHVWSLCIEEQFYLVLPLVLLVMLRRPSSRNTVVLLATLVVAGVAIRTFFFFHTLRPLGAEDAGVLYLERIYYPTWTRMDGLLAGVTLALIEAYRPQWRRWVTARGHTLLAAGLGLFAVSLWLFNDRFSSQTGAAAWGTFVGFPLMSVALALIVASAMSDNGLLHRFPVPGARWIATLAYSLYLTHKEVAHMVGEHWPGLADRPGWQSIPMFGAACVAGAALLHYAIERPFMRLRDRQG